MQVVPPGGFAQQAKNNVGKVLVSLRGTRDLAVRCQNANGLIDSHVLNCLFELISKLKPCCLVDDQAMCIHVVFLSLSVCH